MENQEPVVLTVDEMAVRLRISRGSAYEAIRQGEIPVIRVGKRILIPVAQLDAMLTGESAR